MGESTKIQWTHHTFNPVIGCTKVSPGCDHCYAERTGFRLQVAWGAGAPRRLASESTWRQPLAWNRAAQRDGVRRRVFCASLADVFDKEWPQGARERLFRLIEQTPHLDWLLLTKRIGNAASMMIDADFFPAECPNCWLGITVVNQEEANRDVPKLLGMPTAVRFLSIEPQIEQIDLTQIQVGSGRARNMPGIHFVDALRGASSLRWRGLDWVICGGESGAGARPFNLAWAEDLRDACAQKRVPFFLKQLGARPFYRREGSVQHTERGMRLRIASIDIDCSIELNDRKGGDINEWPADLRVRQFPRIEAA